MTIIRTIFISAIFCIILGFSLPTNAQRPLYDEEYIKNFEMCKPYEDHLLYNLVSGNRIARLDSKETIVGIRNGKCLTQSKVTIRQTNTPILDITCSFTFEQRKSYASKMKAAISDERNKEIYNKARQYYLSNSNICKVINYISEDDD